MRRAELTSRTAKSPLQQRIFQASRFHEHRESRSSSHELKISGLRDLDERRRRGGVSDGVVENLEIVQRNRQSRARALQNFNCKGL